MGNRICDQKDRRHPNEEQDFKAYKNRGGIGDRAENLIELIGLERVVQRNFEYEGTYYVTEDGETYDEEYVDTHNPRRTGVKFYEVSNWRYNKRKEMYEPVVRRIVIIEIKEIQLTLDLWMKK